MTTSDTSASLPTVQTERGGKLKPPECPAKRLTYRTIMKELKGKPKGTSIRDAAVDGLRWRRSDKKGSIVAEYRWNDPITEERRGKTLGRLPTEKELEALHGSSAQHSMWINCDEPVERYRTEARRLAALRLAGHDPASRVGPEGFTLKQAFELHKQGMLNNGSSPLSIAEYELALRHLKDWEDVPLRRLSGKAGRELVRERHLKLGKTRGKGAANKTMRGFGAWWNTARREDPELGESPTIAVQMFKLHPRKSALRTRDLEQFGRELEALRREGRFGELRADFFALALLTGMRKAALASIRREHVDTAARTIFIPAPKGGEARAFTLPLSDAAWEIVERRLAASNSPWLFPSPLDPAKHVSDMRADGAFSDWTDAEGKPVKFTPHELRATFIGAGHAAGVSDRYVQLLANHKLHKGDVHGGYVPEDDLPALRAATQKITDYMRQHGLPV
jgi:integrase